MHCVELYAFHVDFHCAFETFVSLNSFVKLNGDLKRTY